MLAYEIQDESVSIPGRTRSVVPTRMISSNSIDLNFNKAVKDVRPQAELYLPRYSVCGVVYTVSVRSRYS